MHNTVTGYPDVLPSPSAYISYLGMVMLADSPANTVSNHLAMKVGANKILLNLHDSRYQTALHQ